MHGNEVLPPRGDSPAASAPARPRWLVSLFVLVLGTLAVALHLLLAGDASPWWGTRQGLGTTLAGVACCGMILSWRVHGRLRLEAWLLGLGGLAGLGLALFPRGSPAPIDPIPEVVWMFEAPRRGAFLASPLVTEDRVYASAAHDSAFRNAGAVYCLDRETGKEQWRFDDGGKMQHTFSSPCLAEGRLYVGEGMHANFVCKLHCLDAITGKKQWEFVAEGHIESSPCVAEGKVFFSAGDDGIYCLDARTGRKLWRFSGPFHIDSSPIVLGRRLYAGSGISRVYRKTEAWCLDTENGRVCWRYPTDLPVWGSPVLEGDDVFFGLGNGRLLTGPEPPEKPAGAVLCLNAHTGEGRWRHTASDAVFGRVAAEEKRVYFGARDGRVTCLDRATGQPLWQRQLGSPIVASPALHGDRLYIVASKGRISCLERDTGQTRWEYDVAGSSSIEPQLVSSPRVIGLDSGRRIYFGAELRNPVSSAAVVYCLRD